ncbi:unnamed protein product [Phytophthora fragariaefolia]|uniref:Unnamed protein product n=1 Tax=Phytophthora fragariaefolia TaxID=1490495 RepID=A0A9W6UCT7_9STRA|nr:unnamed protein product [Phytophthora fragariaefolia]
MIVKEVPGVGDAEASFVSKEYKGETEVPSKKRADTSAADEATSPVVKAIDATCDGVSAAEACAPVTPTSLCWQHCDPRDE